MNSKEKPLLEVVKVPLGIEANRLATKFAAEQANPKKVNRFI